MKQEHSSYKGLRAESFFCAASISIGQKEVLYFKTSLINTKLTAIMADLVTKILSNCQM